MNPELSERIGRSVRMLRGARGLSQQQMADLSGLPRATWSHLESGAANPTLAVLHRVSQALQVPIEELISSPRAACRHYPAAALPATTRGDAVLRKVLPDKIAGIDLERLELPPGGHLTGIPHMPGTREYLTCERGVLQLRVAGESWKLREGEVVVFRGDQRHSYHNAGGSTAIGYSVLLLAPQADGT